MLAGGTVPGGLERFVCRSVVPGAMVCRSLLVAALLLPVLLLVPSGAGLYFPDDCEAYETITVDAEHPVYLVVPVPPVHENGYPRITWVYEETNGVEGLQRGGEFVVFLDDSQHPGHALDVRDRCGDRANADTVQAWIGGPQRLM